MPSGSPSAQDTREAALDAGRIGIGDVEPVEAEIAGPAEVGDQGGHGLARRAELQLASDLRLEGRGKAEPRQAHVLDRALADEGGQSPLPRQRQAARELSAGEAGFRSRTASPSPVTARVKAAFSPIRPRPSSRRPTLKAAWPPLMMRAVWPKRALDQTEVARGSGGAFSANAAATQGSDSRSSLDGAAHVGARTGREARLNGRFGDLAAGADERGVALAAERDLELHRDRRLDAGAVAEEHEERRRRRRRRRRLAAIDDLVAAAERERPGRRDGDPADVARRPSR